MQNSKNQCIICFDDGAAFKLCDEHSICETCLNRWVESITAETMRSRACDWWIMCPGFTHDNETSRSVECPNIVEFEFLKSIIDISRLTSSAEIVWGTRCDEFISLLSFNCPNTKRCGRLLDPEPDACTAMMCPTCGAHFCFACFERFPNKEDAHAHVSAAHDHEDPFLPREKTLQIHRLIRAQRIWNYLQHMHSKLRSALCRHFVHELADLDIPLSPEEIHQLSMSVKAKNGAGNANVMTMPGEATLRPPIAGEFLSEQQESELMNLANLRRWTDIKYLVNSYRGDGLIVRFNAADHLNRKMLQAAITYPESEFEALELTRFILDNGGAVDEAQEHGHAPLKNAIFKNYVRVAELLLQRGADIELRSENNLTAMELVGELYDRPNWPDDLVEMGLLLMRHGAKFKSLICSNVVIQCCLRDPSFAVVGNPMQMGTAEVPPKTLGALPITDENFLMQLVDRLRWGEMKELVLAHRRSGWKVKFNGTDSRGVKMLQAAITYPTDENQALELVRFILDNGGNVNERQEHGYKALVSAVVKSYVKVAELLLERGADIEAKGGNNNITAMECAGELHNVAENTDAYVDIGLLLMRRGAKCSSSLCENLVRECCNRDPKLASQANVNQPDIVNDDLQAGAAASVEPLGDLPLINEVELIELAGRGKWYTVKELVEGHIASGWKVHFNGPDERGVKLLQAAITYPHSEEEALDLVEFILDHGGSANEYQEGGHTALTAAVYRNYAKVVKLLLDRGALVDLKGVGSDHTPLEMAGELYSRDTSIDRTAVGTLLLLHDASSTNGICGLLVEKCRQVGLGPLPEKEERQIIKLVSAMQWEAMKRSVLFYERRGWSVRFTAADSSKRKILQCIIQSSISNEVCCDLVKFVLNHGADPSDPEVYGFTPLYHAALLNRYEVVTLLLDRGVDLQQKVAPDNNTVFEELCFLYNEQADSTDRVKMGILLLRRGAVHKSKHCLKLVNKCRENDPLVSVGDVSAVAELEQFRREQATKRLEKLKLQRGQILRGGESASIFFDAGKKVPAAVSVALFIGLIAVLIALWFNNTMYK